MKNLSFVNLAGFELNQQRVIENTHTKLVTRSVFNRGLIVITEADPGNKNVKLHSNFEWYQDDNGKWIPDLDKPNSNFHDVEAPE